VSGEYLGASGSVDESGWFATRDSGYLDAEGFLFISGRSDDTIIRGGENIAPAEIEDVVADHPDVVDCAVVGVADDEWGQRIVAVVVTGGTQLAPEEVREWVRARVRGSRTPDQVVFRAELPYTETGKLLRRTLRDELESTDTVRP
jgi:acyl-CoA synthetase (AMP-forming)/AMP-acid ligase II